MTRGPLAGMGVLVTRPEHQSSELMGAITAAGGRPYAFPVMDIEGRNPAEIAADLEGLAPADIVVFVSVNAVIHGLAAVPATGATVVAIGPTTAAALSARGVDVDVVPAGGADSEALLAESGLVDVAGKTVTIVRGQSGRELLGRTLAERGATVRYLAAYRVAPHRFDDDELKALARVWASGGIGAVIVMSAVTFDYLLDALPRACVESLADVRLVAPGDRVLQTALDRMPGLRCVRSPGPRPADLVGALVASVESDPARHGKARDGK